MKTAQGSISLVLFLAIVWPAGVFASTQSLLDPYASIPAPSSKPAADSKKRAKKQAIVKAKSDRPKLAAKQEEQGEEQGNDLKKEIKPAFVKPQAKIVKNVPSADSGIMSGIAEIKDGYVKTFKAAGTGLVNGAKAVGTKIADGAHKVGATVVPDTKSAGNQISKGVGGIGHSVAAAGSKVKEVASSLGNKIVGAPKVLLAQSVKKSTPSAKPEELEPTLPVKVASKKPKDEANFPGKPLEPLSTKPLAKDKSPLSVANLSLAKLNPFAKSKTEALPQPVVLSDLRQSLPN